MVLWLENFVVSFVVSHGRGGEVVERAGGGGYGFCDHGVGAKEWFKGD
jgi:hypothetical protein